MKNLNTLKPVTNKQLALAKHLVYTWKITITLPLTSKEMSQTLTKISYAIQTKQIKLRNAKHGYGEVVEDENGIPQFVHYIEKKFADIPVELETEKEYVLTF